MNVPGSDKSLSNLISPFRETIRRTIPRLIPVECFLCGAEGEVDVLCPACIAVLPRWRRGDACPICALPATAGRTCARCISRPPPFDATIAVYDYVFPVGQLVHALKYRTALDLAAWLGARLAECAGAGWDIVVPVPLHRGRLRERGFNQSLELARPLARRGIRLLRDGVVRSRATPSQAGLDARARWRNVRGTFDVEADLEGCSVVVVDDVMTTGATLRALALALRRAGAVRVANLVVARTPQ